MKKLLFIIIALSNILCCGKSSHSDLVFSEDPYIQSILQYMAVKELDAMLIIIETKPPKEQQNLLTDFFAPQPQWNNNSHGAAYRPRQEEEPSRFYFEVRYKPRRYHHTISVAEQRRQKMVKYLQTPAGKLHVKTESMVRSLSSKTLLDMSHVQESIKKIIKHPRPPTRLTMANLLAEGLRSQTISSSSSIMPAYQNYSLIKPINADNLGPYHQHCNLFMACYRYFSNLEIQSFAQAGLEALADYSNTDNPAERNYHERFIQKCYEFFTSPQIDQPLTPPIQVSQADIVEYSNEAELYLQELDEQDVSYQRESQRAEAFAQSTNMQTSLQTHHIYPGCKDILHRHNINTQFLTHSRGLAINHQIAKELVDIVNKAAPKVKSSSSNQYFKATCQLAHMASIANYSGHIESAIQMTDASYSLFDIALAVGKGVGLGVFRAASFAQQAVMHPVQTMTDMVEMAGTVGYCVFVALENWVALTHYMETDLDKYYEQSTKIRHGLQAGMNMIGKYYQDHTLPEHVENATAFMTEFFIPLQSTRIVKSLHKIVGPGFIAAHNFAQKHASKIPTKILRTALSEAEIYEATSLADKAKQLLTHLKQSTQDKALQAYRAILPSTSLKNIIRAEHLIGDFQAMKDIRQVKSFAEITKNFTDISRLQQHEIAYLNICSWFYPQYLELTQYLKTLDLAITYNGKTYPIKSWGLYHSLIGELPFSARKKITGGHCNYQNMLAAAYDISETKQLAQGFKQVNLCHKKRPAINSKPSTLFPSNWSPRKCVEEIVDTIKNPKKIELDLTNTSPNTISFITTSPQNIELKLSINKENKSLTFFPIKKGIS